MGQFVINVINELIRALGSVLNLIFSVLPNSPFKSFSNSGVEEYLSNIAWLIPFPQIIFLLEAWLSAIIIYYLYQIILRWVKAIN